MSKITERKLFCTKCSLKFGNNLAKFNTDFAFYLHLTTLHEPELIESSVKRGPGRPLVMKVEPEKKPLGRPQSARTPSTISEEEKKRFQIQA